MSIQIENENTTNISTIQSLIIDEVDAQNNIKITGLAERIFKSPLFWTLGLTAGLIAFAVVAFTAPISTTLKIWYQKARKYSNNLANLTLLCEKNAVIRRQGDAELAPSALKP